MLGRFLYVFCLFIGKRNEVTSEEDLRGIILIYFAILSIFGLYGIIPSPGAKRRPRAEGPRARVLISTGV